MSMKAVLTGLANDELTHEIWKRVKNFIALTQACQKEPLSMRTTGEGGYTYQPQHHAFQDDGASGTGLDRAAHGSIWVALTYLALGTLILSRDHMRIVIETHRTKMATETTAVLPMTDDGERNQGGQERSNGVGNSGKRAIAHLGGGAVTQVPSGMSRQLAVDGGSSNVGQLAVFNRGQRELVPTFQGNASFYPTANLLEDCARQLWGVVEMAYDPRASD
ncbi:hypothetical protein Landi51_13785 [Colletotrichum acutatum]